MTFRSALPRNTVPTLLSARAESASADSARVRSLKPAAVAAGSLLVHSKPPPSMAVTALRVAARPREFVGVRGPGAEAFLQAMVSNDVEELAVGVACEALLLTPKARVIAPLVVVRRGPEDFLLLTEPGAGEPVRAALLRMRFAARCEIELEEHTSSVVFGEAEGIPTADYGVAAVEGLDVDLQPTVGGGEAQVPRNKERPP